MPPLGLEPPDPFDAPLQAVRVPITPNVSIWSIRIVDPMRSELPLIGFLMEIAPRQRTNGKKKSGSSPCNRVLLVRPTNSTGSLRTGHWLPRYPTSWAVGNIGKGLKTARERAGLTQSALARTTSQVSQVESGKRLDPQFSTVLRLAVALGVSIDEMASLGGYQTGSSQRVARRDPLARTESILLRLQRDVERLNRRLGEAIQSLPVGPQPKR
jgi:transcriptional regulator with XRE-family HTH domain